LSCSRVGGSRQDDPQSKGESGAVRLDPEGWGQIFDDSRLPYVVGKEGVFASVALDLDPFAALAGVGDALDAFVLEDAILGVTARVAPGDL
jgi:hypothetical protein